MAGSTQTKFAFASIAVAACLIAVPMAASAQSGIASIYSGGLTANGEHASAAGMTAAHRTLPFGTMVRVTNQSTGRSVVVRINDRGPFVRGRIIDVMPAAARALGISGLTAGSRLFRPHQRDARRGRPGRLKQGRSIACCYRGRPMASLFRVQWSDSNIRIPVRQGILRMLDS